MHIGSFSDLSIRNGRLPRTSSSGTVSMPGPETVVACISYIYIYIYIHTHMCSTYIYIYIYTHTTCLYVYILHRH